MRVTALVCAVLAAVAYGIGSVAQAAGARPVPTEPPPDPHGSGAPHGPGGPHDRRSGKPGGVRWLATSRWYRAGLLLDGIGWLASLVALRHLPVFEVQSILAGSLAVTVVLARAVLDARLRRVDLAAVAVAAAASALVAGAARPGPATAPTRGFVVGIVVAAVLCAVAGAALAGTRRAPAAALALVSGAGSSVQVLSARAVSLPGISAAHPLAALVLLVERPLVWTLVVGGLTGIVLYGLALARGGVAAATAILWVVEIVVPTIVGLAVLGDAVRPGWSAALGLGLAGAVAAAVVLAGSPAQQ